VRERREKLETGWREKTRRRDRTCSKTRGGEGGDMASCNSCHATRVMQLASCNSRHATRVMQLQLASCDAISCAGNMVDGRAWEKEAGGERHEGEEFSQMRQCARNVLGGLLSVLRQIVLGVM